MNFSWNQWTIARQNSSNFSCLQGIAEVLDNVHFVQGKFAYTGQDEDEVGPSIYYSMQLTYRPLALKFSSRKYEKVSYENHIKHNISVSIQYYKQQQ